jgi:hypothetical protein
MVLERVAQADPTLPAQVAALKVTQADKDELRSNYNFYHDWLLRCVSAGLRFNGRMFSKVSPGTSL